MQFFWKISLLVTLKLFYLIHSIGVCTLPALLQALLPTSGPFLPRLGVAKHGRCWQWCQVPESSFQFMFQTFQIWFLLENTHFRHLYSYNPPSPFHFCVYLCYKIVFCLSVWVCVLGGCCLHAPTPLHRTDRIESSQTGLEFKWFHTRCYWMSTKTFKTLVSHHPQPPHLPHFPTTVKNNQQCYSFCTWFVHKPYFEYNACRTRCLNQTYEDTNLHLLSVWRGLLYRNKGPCFPIQLKASQMQVTNDKIEIKFLFLFYWFWDPGFVLNSFSAHYATLLCFLCIGCCCYHRRCVCVDKSKLPLCLRQRETEAWFLPSHSQCILWCWCRAPCCCLLTFFWERKTKKQNKELSFS